VALTTLGAPWKTNTGRGTKAQPARRRYLFRLGRYHEDLIRIIMYLFLRLRMYNKFIYSLVAMPVMVVAT